MILPSAPASTSAETLLPDRLDGRRTQAECPLPVSASMSVSGAYRPAERGHCGSLPTSYPRSSDSRPAGFSSTPSPTRSSAPTAFRHLFQPIPRSFSPRGNGYGSSAIPTISLNGITSIFRGQIRLGCHCRRQAREAQQSASGRPDARALHRPPCRLRRRLSGETGPSYSSPTASATRSFTRCGRSVITRMKAARTKQTLLVTMSGHSPRPMP